MPDETTPGQNGGQASVAPSTTSPDALAASPKSARRRAVRVLDGFARVNAAQPQSLAPSNASPADRQMDGLLGVIAKSQWPSCETVTLEQLTPLTETCTPVGRGGRTESARTPCTAALKRLPGKNAGVVDRSTTRVAAKRVSEKDDAPETSVADALPKFVLSSVAPPKAAETAARTMPAEPRASASAQGAVTAHAAARRAADPFLDPKRDESMVPSLRTRTASSHSGQSVSRTTTETVTPDKPPGRATALNSHVSDPEAAAARNGTERAAEKGSAMGEVEAPAVHCANGCGSAGLTDKLTVLRMPLAASHVTLNRLPAARTARAGHAFSAKEKADAGRESATTRVPLSGIPTARSAMDA